MQNEWQAHGTCGWDAAAYFRTIETLFGEVKPPTFAAIASAGNATSGRIEQAFVDASAGWLLLEHVRVSVASGNRLKEVWVWFSTGSQPQPIACPVACTPVAEAQQPKLAGCDFESEALSRVGSGGL
jgi:ribonuclease T2